jgi:hypothetical protein
MPHRCRAVDSFAKVRCPLPDRPGPTRSLFQSLPGRSNRLVIMLSRQLLQFFCRQLGRTLALQLNSLSKRCLIHDGKFGSLNCITSMAKIADGADVVPGPLQYHEISRPALRIIRIEDDYYRPAIDET